MRFLPYVLVTLAGLSLLYGVPILLTGRSGVVEKAMPQLSVKLPQDALFVYGLMFGALSFMIGIVRFLCGFALLNKNKTSREIYVATVLTFVVEIARDVQFSMAGVVSFNESISILISAFFLGWMAVVFRHYTHQ